jgi:sodium-dependent dicarboxylate transporter 2/3/5
MQIHDPKSDGAVWGVHRNDVDRRCAPRNEEIRCTLRPDIVTAERTTTPRRDPRRPFKLLAIVVACAAGWLAPFELEPRARVLLAIFGAVLVSWLTEVVPIAVTALMIAPLLVVCGVTDPVSAFRHYADPFLFLFVGGFMLAESMKRHGLDRRFALAVVTLPFVRRSPRRMQVAILAAATLMSMCISNTATCAIFVPILLGLPGMQRPLDSGNGTRDPAVGPLLALAYVCSTGGIGTLVGTPPNLITVRLLAERGVDIGFGEWLAIGVPSAICLSAAAALITLGRTEVLPAEAPPRVAVGWTRGEIVTAGAFAMAVIGWTLPPLAQAAGVPGASELSARLHPGAVAVLACLPLFLVPDPDARGENGAPGAQPVLPWSAAVRIDWGVILLFGGGIALGQQLEDTGLAAAISRGIVAATGPTDVWTLCAAACATTILVSELASNVAAANMLVPLVIALARELDVSPIPPALAVGLGASVGFMLPIATGPNALVYATGRVPQRSMIRAGALLDLACLVMIVVLLRVLCPLLGWI